MFTASRASAHWILRFSSAEIQITPALLSHSVFFYAAVEPSTGR
jgi:hypothetical protein